MDLGLTGKRAIVTGGSRGIGKAIARVLAEEGADVAVVARTAATLDASAAELAQHTGGRVMAVPADTGDDESVRAMVARTAEVLGGVDILVNCAARPLGQAPPPLLADITNAAFWEDMNIKVLGYLRCAQAVAPLMAEQGWGRIINIAGLGARTTGSAVGSMRNAAVVALTKNLADELGPRGITVTVVHPGLTRTEATPGVVARLAAARGTSEADAEGSLATNSIRRIVDAEEIGWIVAFLASPRAASITGDGVVCGGGHPGPIYY